MNAKQPKPRINWALPKKDEPDFKRITKRAERLLKLHKISFDAVELRMDVMACHLNGCPLDLQKLLDAPDFDFLHDIGGIRRHINRSTAQLEDHFLPRCAA